MARWIRSSGRMPVFVIGACVAFVVSIRTAPAQSGIAAWGYNYQGSSDVPELPPGLTYVAVEAHYFTCVALLSDGTAVAWGNNQHGECNVPALPAGLTYLQLSTGAAHAVAVRSDGSVVAWGNNSYGQCSVPALPPGLTYVEASAGSYHTVARRSDGSVVAWGNNEFRQCRVPPLPPGLTYVEVAAGGSLFNISGHSLARRSDGSIVGWGSIDGSPLLPSGVTCVEISAGEEHNLALCSDGHVLAWGDCFYPPTCYVPGLPSGLTYVGVSAGYAHNLALRSDGSVVAWGGNTDGECDVPTIQAGLRYVQVAAGSSISAARYEGCPTCELPFCLGDGGRRSVPCPCGNDGRYGHGCENSASTGGARLSVHGSVDPDRVVLTATDELPSAVSVIVQGSSVLGPMVTFGDGVRCVGGALLRIAVETAVAGAASYPGHGDPSISSRSAALGDLIRPGTYRYYQVLYRDGDHAFCSSATFNASNAVMVAW